MSGKLSRKLRIVLWALSASFLFTIFSAFTAWHLILKPSIKKNIQDFLVQNQIDASIDWEQLSWQIPLTIKLPSIQFHNPRMKVTVKGSRLNFSLPKLNFQNQSFLWPVSLHTDSLIILLNDPRKHQQQPKTLVTSPELNANHATEMIQFALSLFLNPNLNLSTDLQNLIVKNKKDLLLRGRKISTRRNHEKMMLTIKTLDGNWIRKSSQIAGYLKHENSGQYQMILQSVNHSSPDDLLKLSFDNHLKKIKLFLKNTGIPAPLQNLTRNFIRDPAQTRYALRLHASYLHDANWKFDLQTAVKNLSLSNKGIAIRSLDHTPIIIKSAGTYDSQKNLLDAHGHLSLLEARNKANQVKLLFDASIPITPKATRPDFIEIKAKLQTTSCQKILAALPKQLLGPIQDFRADGSLGFDITIKIPPNRWDNFAYAVKHLRYDCRFDTDQYLFSEDFLRKRSLQLIDADSLQIDAIKPQVAAFLSSRFTKNYGPYLADLLVAAEDAGFWTHRGYEVFALVAAVRRYLQEGQPKIGGSTITMQVARNLYLHHEKTFARKFQELILSQYLESKLTKKEILEIYANIIEYSPGIYGVHAASESLFSLHPSRLNFMQSVFLSSVLPRPSQTIGSFCAAQVIGETKKKMQTVIDRFTQIFSQRGHKIQNTYPSQPGSIAFSKIAHYRSKVCNGENLTRVQVEGMHEEVWINSDNVAWPIPDPPRNNAL